VRTMLLAAPLCAFVSAVGYCLPASSAAASSASDGFFGMNPGDLFKLPQSQWDTHLDAIAAGGVQVVRMGAWWSDLEPGPPVDGQHRYSWSEVDQQVAALARHGLRWEPLLCFSTTWGSKIGGDYMAAPAGADNFAAFAGELARRYGPDGSFWHEHPDLPALPVAAYEVWNEENADLYWHPATPGEYADLYAATRTAIHPVDPAARVVVGGLAASNRDGVVAPADFLRQMYAHRPELRGRVDAVGVHPFARGPQGVYANIAAFRRELDAIAGPGVPIELTEIGWTTADTPEQKRAAYLRELASTLPRSDCGIERLAPYAWVGPEQAAGDREQWFGIAHQDGTPKPSATAYADTVRRMRGLTGAPPADTVPVCSTARLRLTMKVRPDPRRAGRLRIRARCSSSCRLRVELGIARPDGPAPAAGTIPVGQRTTGYRAGPRTLTLKVARRVHRHATRLHVKVTAIGRHGLRATRSRTVHA
jgi:hypothetical protein